MRCVPLKNLTARQREAYVLRFHRGWRLRRIAGELGITVSSAGELVKRAQFRAGLGKETVGVIRTQPRVIRVLSLADWEDTA